MGNLLTSNDEVVQIIDVGTHNHLSGPDFFNAKIQIAEQLWAGTVEMHVKSSDWYGHHHETDINYNNVILHVVWDDDCDVFRSDNTAIPTLELKNYISPNLLNEYQKLFRHKEGSFINCEKDIANIDGFVWRNWLELLYFDRLEGKSNRMDELLKEYNNDWEQVFFILLAKNFGLKINGDAFLEIAKRLHFSTLRKIQGNALQLESLLFGLAGFLSEDAIGDDYFKDLKKEFLFLRSKFNIEMDPLIRKPEFFKLRPSNFPTIRLSQLANLYSLHQHLFAKIIDAGSLWEIHALFNVGASEYWDDHYTFGKVSKKYNKRLSKKFVDLLVINSVLPAKLAYARQVGADVGPLIRKIISGVASENNSVISKFRTLQVQFPSAKESQAVLQLYNGYCTKNKCLQCAVGQGLLHGKP